MKDYPSILGSKEIPWGEECISFYKYDGSNLRFEYNKKQGWYKFGTRHRLFDQTDSEYGVAIDIFQKKYGDALAKTICDKFPKLESAIAYAEFFGPYSFAGKHDATWLSQKGLLPEGKNNNEKDLVLFDVNIHKNGFVSPVDFIKTFSHLHIPQVIYQGPLTEEFAQDVRTGKYPVTEGVVAKGGNSAHKIWMRKIKTYNYLEKLKEIFPNNYKEYGEG